MSADYRDLYERAADRAGREYWEPVEEDALRAEFGAAGFGHLLAWNGGMPELVGVEGWSFVDVSADGEPTDNRWYYASGDEPRPDEFRRFHELLVDAAPDDYEPWYFRVERAGKAPATQFGSWKHPDSRLTVAEAVDWMEQGGNVGLAGTGPCRGCGGRASEYCPHCEGEGFDGPLVNIDIDDDEETTPADLPDTLRARSRSRSGWHAWAFDENNGSDDEIPNIPTDDAGEIRASWQYVVAAGSFVPSTAEEIPDEYHDDSPGYYTVADDNPVATFGFDDLPEVFRDLYESDPETVADVLDDSDSPDTPDSVESALEGSEGDESDAVEPDTDVFDLAITDVPPVPSRGASDRFAAVWHGSGTGSNMSVSSDTNTVTCWRHTCSHGPLQALAVLNDECDHGCEGLGEGLKNPDGSYKSDTGPNVLKGHWKLIWYAWAEAKRRDVIDADDPVPHRALLGRAVADGVIDADAVVERDGDGGDTYQGFPGVEAYNDAVRHVRDEYDLDPGREPATAAHEPVGAVPFGQLDALDAADARRHAQNHGVEWPTTREARQRLETELYDCMRAGQTAVLDAPTALGKTYTVATEPWLDRADVTREKPVVQLHETREARDQAAAQSDAANVSYNVLKGRTEACPVAAGHHDPSDGDDAADSGSESDDSQVITLDGRPASEWFETVCEGRGVPVSVAHRYLDDNNDQDAELPCCEGDERCETEAMWDNVPWTDDGDPAVDVVHATHPFAHVPSLRNHTHLMFDERPDFREDLSHSRIRRAVAAFLTDAGAPVTDFERFVARAREGGGDANEHAEYQYVRDALEHEPERDWYLEASDAHTLAPALTRAIWHALSPDGDADTSEPDANGRFAGAVAHEPPRLDANAKSDDHWNMEWVRVVLDADHTVQTVRSAPDCTLASSVIGLDAHPSVHLWQLNVSPNIDGRPVLEPTERRLWRRYERGLTVVQAGDATRPLTSGEYYDDRGTRQFIQALRDRYGDGFQTAISSGAVEGQLQDALREVGVDDPTEKTMHFGEEKSRGDFSDEDVGLVNGCIDPGDEYVVNLLAERGLDATPAAVECSECDGDGCPTCDNSGRRREHGRTFDGPDADAAAELLGTVREQHVAQAAGRYARNADDVDDRAVVFVRTDATPPGFVDLQVPGVEWVPTDLQREVIETLRETTATTARELAERVDASREHVRQTLDRLRDDGVVTRREKAGRYGAHLYGWGGSVSDTAVGLEPATSNGDVGESYTWSLEIDAAAAPDTATVTVATPATAGSDAPPDTTAATDDGPPPG